MLEDHSAYKHTILGSQMTVEELLQHLTHYELVIRGYRSQFFQADKGYVLLSLHRAGYERATYELIDLIKDEFNPEENLSKRFASAVAAASHNHYGGPNAVGVDGIISLTQSLITRLKRKPSIAMSNSPVATPRGKTGEQESRFDWRLLHPKVVDLSQAKFQDGYFADAVATAFRELINRVKAIHIEQSGRELDGAKLIQHAFGTNGTIVVDDLSTETGRNIQSGYKDLFVGAIAAIRNPVSHQNIVISAELALHYLFLASMLFLVLDDPLTHFRRPNNENENAAL